MNECCLHMPTFAAFLSQASRAYLALTKQLEEIVNEAYMVQVLRLRTNHGKCMRAKVTYNVMKSHRSSQ